MIDLEKNKVNKKKIVIKDKKKFINAMIVLVAIIIFIIILISITGKKVKIDNTTDITKLSTKKYSEQILEYYNGADMEEMFISDYNDLNSVLWTYVYQNITQDQTIESLCSDVNKILETDDWSVLGIQKNTRWAGKWSIDAESNILKFKFENKKIEPTWIENDSVSGYIDKNDV